jgi:hypothetical protein
VRADAFLSSISGARTRQAARLLFASLRQRCSPHSAKNLLVKGGDGSEPAENRGPPLETSTSYPRPPGVAIVARNGNLVRLLNDGGGLEPRLSAGVSRTGSHDTRTSLARRRRRFFRFTAGLTRTDPAHARARAWPPSPNRTSPFTRDRSWFRARRTRPDRDTSRLLEARPPLVAPGLRA